MNQLKPPINARPAVTINNEPLTIVNGSGRLQCNPADPPNMTVAVGGVEFVAITSGTPAVGEYKIVTYTMSTGGVVNLPLLEFAPNLTASGVVTYDGIGTSITSELMQDIVDFLTPIAAPTSVDLLAMYPATSERYMRGRPGDIAYVGLNPAYDIYISDGGSWNKIAAGSTVDTIAPVVQSFVIPSTSDSLTVSVSSFVATDNVAVVGYMITESTSIPLPGDSRWRTTAQTSFTFAAEGSKTAYAWAKDAAGNVSPYKSAPCVVTLLDTTLPVVTAFVIPSTSNSYTVPISTFTATDNIGVTGYLITESATKPSPGADGWSASAPTTYVFSSSGAKTLYGWAKDAVGNVSDSLNDSVTISVDSTPPTVSAFTVGAVDVLSVPVTAFTATDNVGVTGYLITESATPPAVDAPGWTGSAPTSYTASSIGTKSLYPWAKDGANNVSAVFDTPRSVTFTSPLAAWGYSKAMTVSDPLDAAVLTVKVVRGTGTDTGAMVYVDPAKCSSDFRDLRFSTTLDAVLPFYISETSGTDYAICKVEATANTTIKMHYGNPNASPDATNPPAVGTFSHDFRGPRQHLAIGQYINSTTQYNTWHTDAWENQLLTRNGVTYITWWEYSSSAYLIIKGCTFTHSTRAYTSTITIFNESVSGDGSGTDSHCIPTLSVDASGNFHIFSGAHNGILKYKTASTFAGLASAATENITVGGSVVNHTTYPASFCIGDDVYCFFRGGINSNAALALRYYAFVKKTAGVWSLKTVLYNSYAPGGVTLDIRSYANVYYDGSKIHMSIFAQTEYAATEAAYHGAYYLYSPDGGVTWKTADDGLSYSGATLPITNDTATAWDTKLAPYILPYATSSTRAMAVRVTAAGKPVVLYVEVVNPTTVPVLFADVNMWVAEWSGSAWAKHAITSGGKWEHHTDLLIVGDEWKFCGAVQNANGKYGIKVLSATSPTQTSDWDNDTAPFIDGGTFANSSIMEPRWEQDTDNPSYVQLVYSSCNDSTAYNLHGSMIHYRYSEAADYGTWSNTNINEAMITSTAPQNNYLFDGYLGNGYIRTTRNNVDMRHIAPAISSFPTLFNLDVELYVVNSGTAYGGYMYVTASNGTSNPASASPPAKMIRFDINSIDANTLTLRGQHYADATYQAATPVNVATNTKYYATLTPINSNKGVRLSIYSDPLRTSLVGTADSASNATAIGSDFQYLTISNNYSSSTPNKNLSGYLYNVNLYPTAATPPSITGWGTEVAN